MADFFARKDLADFFLEALLDFFAVGFAYSVSNILSYLNITHLPNILPFCMELLANHYVCQNTQEPFFFLKSFTGLHTEFSKVLTFSAGSRLQLFQEFTINVNLFRSSANFESKSAHAGLFYRGSALLYPNRNMPICLYTGRRSLNGGWGGGGGRHSQQMQR